MIDSIKLCSEVESICLEYLGNTFLLRTDDRSRSDQARMKAVLGGGERGSPPPAMGVRGCYLRNIFEFYIAVDGVLVHFHSFCVHSLMLQRVKESHKKRFHFSFFHNLLKFLYLYGLPTQPFIY